MHTAYFPIPLISNLIPISMKDFDKLFLLTFYPLKGHMQLKAAGLFKYM